MLLLLQFESILKNNQVTRLWVLTRARYNCCSLSLSHCSSLTLNNQKGSPWPWGLTKAGDLWRGDTSTSSTGLFSVWLLLFSLVIWETHNPLRNPFCPKEWEWDSEGRKRLDYWRGTRWRLGTPNSPGLTPELCTNGRRWELNHDTTHCPRLTLAQQSVADGKTPQRTWGSAEKEFVTSGTTPSPETVNQQDPAHYQKDALHGTHNSLTHKERTGKGDWFSREKPMATADMEITQTLMFSALIFRKRYYFQILK